MTDATATAIVHRLIDAGQLALQDHADLLDRLAEAIETDPDTAADHIGAVDSAGRTALVPVADYALAIYYATHRAHPSTCFRTAQPLIDLHWAASNLLSAADLAAEVA